MKKLLISPIGMNPAGAGPKIFSRAIPFLIAGIVIRIFFPTIAEFPAFFSVYLKYTGIAFIVLGMIIYIITIIQFLKSFNKGKLITTGVYKYSRNPLYASWIIFILPGLAFYFNNWIFLTAAFAMYIACRLYIKSEEVQLMASFGDAYTEYCNKVGRIGFVPGFRK